MDLPDCPPGTEGYEDTVIEVPKKPDKDDSECTKAEQEFQEHLNSLKVKVEDGTTRCMVERRGRDVSHNWIYLCYPCGAVCCGENILQVHISGKKHKNRLMIRSVWPPNIFENHPYLLKEKGIVKTGAATSQINQKMAEEVAIHNNLSDSDQKYQKYREVVCHLQETLDKVKTPLLGIEYLIEHPPEGANQEPSYLCTLCSKQGHQRTIINHITCFQHRCNYFCRHFYKAAALLAPHRRRLNARKGALIIVNRLAQRIEDTYGRLKPVNIEKEEFERDKDRIIQWICKGFHFSEDLGHTFEEVVDEELINSLTDSDTPHKTEQRNPSPPVVRAPTRPKPYAVNHQQKSGSVESLSDISEDELQRHGDGPRDSVHSHRERKKLTQEPYLRDHGMSFHSRSTIKNAPASEKAAKPQKYKIVLLEDKKKNAIESAQKILAYHEKNPEKHPLYPEEWKKFWNKRYKEIQAEGKDPSKHDFKSEWIPFWTARMKELHDEELRMNITELYRKMDVPMLDSDAYVEVRHSAEDRRSPSGKNRSPRDGRSRSPLKNRTLGPRRRSPDPRRRSPDPRRRSPIPRRRSPDLRRRSPDIRRRSPDMKRRSPFPRRHSPDGYDRAPSPKRMSPYRRQRSPDSRKRSPINYRRDKRTPPRRRTPGNHYSPRRSRSSSKKRLGSPGVYGREGRRRNVSPLSQRAEHRNLSPKTLAPHAEHTAPSLQTVLISDDELRPDDGLSPWNSDNDIDSLDSVSERRSHSASVVSRNSRTKHGNYGGQGSRGAPANKAPAPQDFGPTDNVIATLRLLVALEDYLGSLGPKVIDLLTEALKMEKERANSSEELLDRESAVALLETAKEKLKGAVQAGLVAGSAAAAVRATVMRLAAALHEADKRDRNRSKASGTEGGGAVAVAGVGAVDRAEIAAQMAAALVAEGRTDVSPQELEQLIDAVVGMAEAKQLEKQTKQQGQSASGDTQRAASAKSSTTSALQMLQSAYDDPNALPPKEDASDAMDGLSDSDLETLLKNFNELSAEEQHSLIAYLKKLEVRSPQRVEKLRQFVGAAAAGAPPIDDKDDKGDTDLVTIQSDDDDYTVEEVFKSATQKVKENQFQQEMEIVKKSLEETKTVVEPASTTEPINLEPSVKTPLSLSSAADLLALVHASIQTTSQSRPAEVNQTADVASTNQPRSFGDMPSSSMANVEPTKPLLSLPAHVSSDFQNRQSPNQGNTHSPQSQMSFRTNTNVSNETYNDNTQAQNGTDRQNMTNNRPSYMGDNLQAVMNDNRQFPTDNSYQPLTGESRQPLIGNNIPTSMGDYRQLPDNRQPFMSDNRQPSGDNRQTSMSGNWQPLKAENMQPILGTNRPSLLGDNRQLSLGDNRQSLLGDIFNRSLENNRQSAMGNIRPLMGDNRQLLIGDNRQPLMGDNRQNFIGHNRLLMGDNRQNLMENNRQPLMTGNRQQQQPLVGDNRQTLIGDGNQPSGDNRQPFMTDNRWPATADNNGQQTGYDNFNQNRSFNPRGRNNFINNHMQDNFNTQPEMNQQNFNNYQKNPNANFRGRGRGFQAGRGFQGGGRGRGRGRQ